MAADLSHMLDTDEDELFDGKSVLLSDSCVDGSFLIHHWVALYIKHGHNVCLLSFTQSGNHYISVGNKFGININAAKEKGQYVFIEGLKKCSDVVIASQEFTTNYESTTEFINLNDNKTGLRDLFHTIKSTLEKFPKNQQRQTILVIDGLSVLLSLGCSVENVVDLIHYLRLLLLSPVNNRHGCLVAMVNNDDDVDDDDCDALCKHLSHSSHLCVHATGLASGYCKDVHGQLTATWRDPSCTTADVCRKKKMHYKVSDKNISLFALGTSAAVL